LLKLISDGMTLVLGRACGIFDKTTNQPTPVKGQGVVVTHNVKDSYINSDAEKTIAIDLKNILIIFKNGQLLVANKNSTEFIKPLVVDNT